MGIKSFRRIRTGNTDVKQLQDAVANTLQTITSRDILDGVLIANVFIASGSSKNVEHKLQRKPKGYFVIKKDANSTIWDEEAVLPEKHLTLSASNDVTINLWVF